MNPTAIILIKLVLAVALYRAARSMYRRRYTSRRQRIFLLPMLAVAFVTLAAA